MLHDDARHLQAVVGIFLLQGHLSSQVVTPSGSESSRLNRSRWGNHEAGRQHMILGGPAAVKNGRH